MERRMIKLSRVWTLIIAVAALASLWFAGAAVAAASRANYVPNEYIIHVTPGAPRADVDKLAAKLGAVVVSKLSFDDTYLIRVTSNLRRPYARSVAPSAVSWRIDYIQPNYRRYALAEPNDEYWVDGSLWGMKMINMPRAWDIEKGSNTVIVAVNDTGVAKHPDLIDRLLPGYNFVDNNNDANADDVGHGTHVAGTIAAIGNNQIGVVGVCWEGVKILPVRVLGDSGGSTQTVIDGLDFALKNGAKVVNMSYGGPGLDPMEQAKIKQLAQAGVILVAAAGNESSSFCGYPAGFPECITVSAVGPTEALATYSNFGADIDIAAPGGDQEFRRLEKDGILSTVINTETKALEYAYFQGTSMAAPHVSGAAAILLSQGIKAGDVRSRLEETARPPITGNMDKLKYGAGIIDVYAALADSSLRITKPSRGAVVGTNPEFRVSLRGIDPNSVEIYLDYSDGNGDGIPDYSTELPIVDSSNINSFINASDTEIAVQWSSLSSDPLSSAPSANPHQIYVKGTSSQTGEVLSDWVAFTVASKVIPKGIHMFAFPYNLPAQATAPYRTQPSEILFDKQTGQPVNFSTATLATWVPKTYNQITRRLESRYAYYPEDYLAWTDPYDSMPVPTNPTVSMGWITAGGYPVGDPNDPPVHTFPAGAGYWLILSEDAVVVDNATVPTLNAPYGYTIPLYEGWNMIGNPYDHAVSWKALFHYHGMTKTMQDAEASGWIRSKLYGYRSTPTPGYYLLPENSLLQSYTGYWLRANVGGVSAYDSLKMTILP